MFIYGDLKRMANRSTYIGDINWKNNETHVFEPYAEQEFYYATVNVVPPPSSFVYVQSSLVWAFLVLISHILALLPIVSLTGISIAFLFTLISSRQP